MRTIGVISYHSRHLKTEQLVTTLVNSESVSKVFILAQDFQSRPDRDELFRHRPSQALGCFTEDLAALPRVEYIRWDHREETPASIECFAIAGAGLLDIAFACGRPIYNVHPGWIPRVRGLDAFKWAVYDGKALANTLHEIDNEADLGKVLSIEQTPVFPSDTLESVARRHYEAEIRILLGALSRPLKAREVDSRDRIGEPRRRMPKATEHEMVLRFADWKSKFQYTPTSPINY